MAEPAENPYVGPRPFERGDGPSVLRPRCRDRGARCRSSSPTASCFSIARPAPARLALQRRARCRCSSGGGFRGPADRPRRVRLPDGRPRGRAAKSYILDVLSRCKQVRAPGSTMRPATAGRSPQFSPRSLAPAEEPVCAAPRTLVLDQFEELFTLSPSTGGSGAEVLRPGREAHSGTTRCYASCSRSARITSPNSTRTRRSSPASCDADSGSSGSARAALRRGRRPVREDRQAHVRPGSPERLVVKPAPLPDRRRRARMPTSRASSSSLCSFRSSVRSLWSELPGDATTITEAHLRTFGDVDKVLRQFYDGRSGLRPGGARRESRRTPADRRGIHHIRGDPRHRLPGRNFDS